VIYRTTRVFNFAQGGFGALGAYVSFTVFVLWHQPFWMGLILGCLTTGFFAAVVERVALRPLYRRGELFTFISTIGLGFAIQSGIQWIWSPIPRIVPSVLGSDPVTIFGLRIVPQTFWILMISLMLGAAAYGFLGYTKLGTAMRAAAQDREVAGLLGINVNVVYSLAFFISGILGAFAGILIAPVTFLSPTLGFSIGLPGFIAALVGGLGSMPGAICGGLILGIAQAMAIFIIAPRYRDFILYAILVLVVLARPSGLFGEETVQSRQA